MAYTDPSVQNFKDYFVRDFPYGTDINTSILDGDITKSFTDASMNINPANWASQGYYTIGFLNLAAHYLVMNIRASSQGISGQWNWAQASKGVGGVSESFAIPERILANPEFEYLTKTNYGMKYLATLLPQLVGNIFTVCGGTHP